MRSGLLGLPGLTHENIATDRLRKLLAEVSTVQGLLDLGVERAYTLYPEWGMAFTHLDKGGRGRTPGIENRPQAPPKNLLGKRVAFHMGAHIGGRKGSNGFSEGVRGLLGTARVAGWAVTPFNHPRGGTFYELRKHDQMVSLDPGWNPLRGGQPIGTASTIGVPLSAITFTGVLSGFEQPTDSPKYPWQHASDPEDSEDWSYGWHVTDVVVLKAPIPVPQGGLQGPWGLSRLLKASTR